MWTASREAAPVTSRMGTGMRLVMHSCLPLLAVHRAALVTHPVLAAHWYKVQAAHSRAPRFCRSWSRALLRERRILSMLGDHDFPYARHPIAS